MTSLSLQLKAATAGLHAAVEGSAFMQRLLRGGLGRSGRSAAWEYAAYLRNLREIYAVLEGATPDAPSALARLGFDPGLARLGAIESDLEGWQGPSWRAELPVLESTHRYRERLVELGVVRVETCVAHVYVRYLGDLHGGQALARIVARQSASAVAGGGVAFYDFGPSDRVAHHKQALRQRLDEIGALADDQETIVEEAGLAFRLHAELFGELEALTSQRDKALST